MQVYLVGGAVRDHLLGHPITKKIMWLSARAGTIAC